MINYWSWTTDQPVLPVCCKYEECEHFALFDSGDQGKSSEEEESNESEDED